MKRRVLGLTALVLSLAACGSTTADTVGLHYGGGPIEGDHFEKIVEPGSGSQFLGPMDRIVRLPINQRDYTFCEETRKDSDDRGCDTKPIKVTALGGADVGISGGVTFELNTGSEEILLDFYNEVCRKFDCAGKGGVNSDGWAEMLRVNMRGPLEDALQEEIRGYSVDALYAGVPAEGEETSEEEALSTLTKVSDAIESRLKETINKYAGGDFFCGPGYDRSKPDECPNFEFVITEVTPSKEVREAFNKNVASRQAVIDARNRADAEIIEAQGKREAQDALAGIFNLPGYIEYLRALALQECASRDGCVLIVGDSGNTNVNVQPR